MVISISDQFHVLFSGGILYIFLLSFKSRYSSAPKVFGHDWCGFGAAEPPQLVNL